MKKIERTCKASIDQVWDLWTTKEGFESWWGPEGFEAKVIKLDFRAGGEIQYAMIAVGPEQVRFMKEAGMPLQHHARHIFAEITPKQRLSQRHVIDFIPGVKPYEVTSVVDFHAEGAGVRVVLALGDLHNEEWTQRFVMGWESQLGKLSKALENVISKRRLHHE